MSGLLCVADLFLNAEERKTAKVRSDPNRTNSSCAVELASNGQVTPVTAGYPFTTPLHTEKHELEECDLGVMLVDRHIHEISIKLLPIRI